MAANLINMTKFKDRTHHIAQPEHTRKFEYVCMYVYRVVNDITLPIYSVQISYITHRKRKKRF